MPDYSNMIAVTNRHTFDTFPDPETAFLTQIARVAGFTPKAIVLREKDLDEKSYTQLAEKVLRIGTSEGPESIPDPMAYPPRIKRIRPGIAYFPIFLSSLSSILIPFSKMHS